MRYPWVKNISLQKSKECNVMDISTVTSKGQITIPKSVRQHLKLEAGSKVRFVLEEDGTARIIPLNVPIESLAGILHKPGMKAVSVEEMEHAIAEGWFNRPNRALGGTKPLELLDTDAGVEQVVDLLNRIDYGVYS
jgi:antitoxin PrlF